MNDDPDFEMEVISEGEVDSVDGGSSSQSKTDLAEETSGVDGTASTNEIFGLGTIPESWGVESLPRIAKVEMGSSPPSSTYNEDEEGLPFYQGNADFGYLSPEVSTWCSDPVKTADEDDILISIRAPVGDLNIANEHCCIGRGLAALRPNEINGLYLFYALAKMSRWLSRLASGSTFESVSSADLEKVDLAIPPLPEQRKIASVLYTVDQAIQKTEAIIEQTERVKHGVAQNLFRKGTRNQDTNNTWLGEIPASWRVVPFGEIISSTRNGIYKQSSAYGGGYPIAKMGNALDNRVLDMRDHDRLKLTESEKEKYSLRYGDLIFARRAQEVSGAGHCTFVPNLEEVTVFESSLIRVRLSKGVSPKFYAQYFEGPVGSRAMKRIVTETSISGIATSDLLNLEVPVPDEDEQEEIASILTCYDRQVESLYDESEELKRLKKGLMQDLLTGEVRTVDKAIQVLDEVEAHG